MKVLHQHFGRGTVIFLALVLLAGCGSEPPAPIAGPPALTLPEVKLQAFAPLPPPAPPAVTPSLQDTASNLAQAANYPEVMSFLGVRLSAAQQKFLNDHKFLLIPKGATRFQGQFSFEGCHFGYAWDEMLGLFDAFCGSSSSPLDRRPENCRLVTPDVVLHAFHKYFENSLEYLEEHDLGPLLRRFLQQAQSQALAYRKMSGPELAPRYELLAAQFTVPLILLENARWPQARTPEGKLPPVEAGAKPEVAGSLDQALVLLQKFRGQFSPEMDARLAAELRAIYEARAVAVSPLWGSYDPQGQVKCDYTQYLPRSHYAKNSRLRGYFRAMMYLGRSGYPLARPQGLTDAMLVAHLLATPGAQGRPTLLHDWQQIMEITAFYAGQSDDLTYPQWRDFLVRQLGSPACSPAQAVNSQVLTKISRNLGDLQGPRILSEVIIGAGVLHASKEELLKSVKSFRIFGQRFTFDAWILNRLTAGQEKTKVRLPSMPSALCVPAAVGDRTARGFVAPFLSKLRPPFSPEEVAGFSGRLDKVAADLTRVSEPEWFSSLGTAWLKILTTLTASYGQGYPHYMQSPLFPVKQLQTFLGSYTELKHDTLLYGKQSYAEAGNGEEEQEPPPVPKGLVEPNLSFWQALQRLVDYTSAGFRKYGLFQDELEKYGRLSRFQRQVKFYTALARQELQGQPLTPDEYEKLRTQELSFMAQPFDPSLVLEEKDLRSALIADIHTDAVDGQVLYEATAEPYIMLALVGNDGTVRLTLGVAFNHYELSGPLARRYTDGDWQTLVYEQPARLPAKNFWYEGLLSR
jgi:hypothetical protein